MTTPQQEGTQPWEENDARILSSFVHIENVNGPQYIFNCGHRSLNEMLALQDWVANSLSLDGIVIHIASDMQYISIQITKVPFTNEMKFRASFFVVLCVPE